VNPLTKTTSCWVFTNNYVHDNNNPNVPYEGSAGAGPLGTGMTVSGGRNDTVVHNTFSNNGAWGILFIPYADSGTPDGGKTCEGQGGVKVDGLGCVLDPIGNALLDNTFTHNGFYGNPSNGDYGLLALIPGEAANCFAGNRTDKGSTPADLQTTNPTCGAKTAAAVAPADLLGQVLCDTGVGSCPKGSSYPKQTGVIMQPLPPNLATMPNPCVGVPDNAWCQAGAVVP
jgi:hypothetical protein